MPERQTPFTSGELEHRMRRAGLTQVVVEPLGATWEEAMLLGGIGVKP